MGASSKHIPKRIPAFFYGSFIRKDIMALGDFYPERIEVAKLNGYDIAFDPHANIFRCENRAICGVLVYPSHEELNKLYARDGVGIFLPEAVVVETIDHKLVPAMCYMPPARGTAAADTEYVDKLITAGIDHGFPSWYVDRLKELRDMST
jgi:hypothetical protein